jgi:class 3 adenylate cyclase/predicted ATPase
VPLPMSLEQQQLKAAIATLEEQRSVLGDALLEAALHPLRARLAALDSPQALKFVSILFLDVVGSTDLSRRLDPEEVHQVMDAVLERCTVIIESHQGKVLKYAGDSVLAVFGATETREDDAQRAVMAGLEMLEEGNRQEVLIRERYSHQGFNVRVGIHCGNVLLGGGLDAENNIRGFDVNVAARMEQSAPAGALRISHACYRQVRGLFDVAQQPPIEVKGVPEPMLTYLVLRRKPRAFRMAMRGIEGIETCMVGRDADLAKLQDTFRNLYQQEALALVAVQAEAGLGKSRLLYEFENWAEAQQEQFFFFQGRANARTHSQPYGLLRDILTWRFQIDDADTDAQAREKLEKGLIPLFEKSGLYELALAQAHVLGHLIGMDFSDSVHVQGMRDDGHQMRGRGFHAAAQFFKYLSRSEGLPIVLVMDDLHWIDGGSLDFLRYLVQANRDLAMMILTLARPGRSELTDLPGTTLTIHLNPLDPDASLHLAGELLKKLPNIPVALQDILTAGAAGNPFYMEELVKMLIDEGAIATANAQWTVHAEKLINTRVPPTLTGVLQARLDALEPAEKRALQQASVIGHVFWDSALGSLQAGSAQLLPSLVQHGLVVSHTDAALDGVHEYAFAHQILHQVTYETLLKRERRDLHARVANWLAGLNDRRAGEFLGLTAEHFQKGEDFAQACLYYTRAAERAGSRYAHEAAQAYVAQGMGLASGPSDTALRWRLLNVRERSLDLEGKRTAQLADIAALRALADALGDDRKRSEVAWRQSSFALRTGQYAEMESAARAALEFAARFSDPAWTLRCQQRLALALTYQGQPAAGRLVAEEGLASARALGERALEALFLNALSVSADSEADPLACLELDRQDLLINRELGNRRNEAIALSNLGNGWLRLGAHAQAREFLEEGLRLIHAIGDRATEPNTLVNLSILALRQGDTAQALAQARAALDSAGAVGNPEFEALALYVLGNAELASGRAPIARTAFERALSLANDSGDPTRLDALGGLARACLANGEGERAIECALEILKHLDQGGGLDGIEAPCEVLLTTYRVLGGAGHARAPEVLSLAHAELRRRLAALTDENLRTDLLQNIPEHRATAQAWADSMGRRSDSA